MIITEDTQYKVTIEAITPTMEQTIADSIRTIDYGCEKCEAHEETIEELQGIINDRAAELIDLDELLQNEADSILENLPFNDWFAMHGADNKEKLLKAGYNEEDIADFMQFDCFIEKAEYYGSIWGDDTKIIIPVGEIELPIDQFPEWCKPYLEYEYCVNGEYVYIICESIALVIKPKDDE